MSLVDAQLHTSAEMPEHRPAPELVAMMDAVGVERAILVQLSALGTDNSYPLAAADRFPERFAVVGALDPAAPDQDEVVGAWRELPHTVGIRVPAAAQAAREALAGGSFDAQMAAAERLEVPVCIFAPGQFGSIRRLATEYPRLQLVLDHLGLPAPPAMDPGPEPFAPLPDLLALAELPNVAVKWSGAPALSLEAYPFDDLRTPLRALLQAFGAGRLMWGSDATRVASLHTYREAVDHVADASWLTPEEKEDLLAGTARRLFGLADRVEI